VTIHYQIEGDGEETVLLISGLGMTFASGMASSRSWPQLAYASCGSTTVGDQAVIVYRSMRPVDDAAGRSKARRELFMELGGCFG
jgi:hypothetical protein